MASELAAAQSAVASLKAASDSGQLQLRQQLTQLQVPVAPSRPLALPMATMPRSFKANHTSVSREAKKQEEQFTLTVSNLQKQLSVSGLGWTVDLDLAH